MLTKAQGKGTCALPKNLRRHWTTIWQRKAVWKTLFQNKPSGTINPVYLPRKLLNNTKNVSNKKDCLSQILPNIFLVQLWRNIPFTIMTLIVFCLEIMQWKENVSILILWTWKGMILKGIFLSNFWKSNNPYTCYTWYWCFEKIIYPWSVASDGCPVEVASPRLLWSGFQ